MREILFRGKRIDSGEWEYGGCVFTENEVCLIYNQTHSIDLQGWTVDRNTVGQYTGRKDDNGRKVFKGDIATYAEDGIRGDFSQGVMEIVWNGKTAGFCGRTAQGRLVEIAHLKNVIGNVHDNLELLEV